MADLQQVEGVVSVLGGAKVVGKSVRSPEGLAERVRKGLPFAALIAGNAVVIKVSEWTSWSAAEYVEIVHRVLRKHGLR